jgi:hypothetical protein
MAHAGRKPRAEAETAPATEVVAGQEQTAEFKAAVAAAVAETVSKLLPDLIAKVTPAGATPSLDNQGWAERMALAIAQLTEQRDGQHFVAPAIIQARKEAREKMMDVIVSYRISWSHARERGDKSAMNDTMPSYKLRNKVFLDETLVDPMWIDGAHKAQDTIIDWPGVPNESMIPQNEAAKAVYSLFIGSVGNVEKVVPDKPLHLTAGGLVVKGPPPRGVRNTGVIDAGALPEPAGEGLSVKHKADQKYKEINVLGTAHQPARQAV